MAGAHVGHKKAVLAAAGVAKQVRRPVCHRQARHDVDEARVLHAQARSWRGHHASCVAAAYCSRRIAQLAIASVIKRVEHRAQVQRRSHTRLGAKLRNGSAHVERARRPAVHVEARRDVKVGRRRVDARARNEGVGGAADCVAQVCQRRAAKQLESSEKGVVLLCKGER